MLLGPACPRRCFCRRLRAFKRIFVWLGPAAEKATETDAINQAVVERGIRDAKTETDKAHCANGQLAGQIGHDQGPDQAPEAAAR